MTIQEAAANFEKQFRQYDWFQSVGIGENDTLYVCTRRYAPGQLVQQTIRHGWNGFKVKFRRVGKIQANKGKA